MSIKDFIMPALLALALMWGWNYFFPGKVAEDGSRAGTSFVAPKGVLEVRPLNLSVDYIAAPQEVHLTQVETPYATMTFSNEGAVLQELNFIMHHNSTPVLMSTITPTFNIDRDTKAFLLAFDKLTPLNYRLISNVNNGHTIDLVYQLETDFVRVNKAFSISLNEHAIDLKLEIEPLKSSIKAPRLLFPSPFMSDMEYDVYSGLVMNKNGSIEKTLLKKIDASNGWYSPAMIGAENKYFAHMLIGDMSNFVQRAYYKVSCDSLITILEGVDVDKKSSWQMKFYFGPKTEQAVSRVDDRLNGIVDYSGFFAPVSRLLLATLKFIHHYVHNYGLAIILLTLLLKLLMLPLSYRSQSKMREDMRKQEEFKRKMAYIQQRYKDEPETLMRERTELMRTHGMPGLGNVIPGLLQIPIFIGLNKALSSSVELYRAPFLWISDLSAHDPYYILPILVALTMVAQALTGDAKQRLTMLAFSLIIGAIAASLSAGLALFILVSTATGVLQSIVSK